MTSEKTVSESLSVHNLTVLASAFSLKGDEHTAEIVRDTVQHMRDIEARARELEAERDSLATLRDDALEMYDNERRKRVDAEQYAADYLAEVRRLTPLVADARGAVELLREAGDALFLSTVGFAPDAQMASARVGWKNARRGAALANEASQGGIKCSTCGGTGKAPSHGRLGGACDYCNGTGKAVDGQSKGEEKS